MRSPGDARPQAESARSRSEALVLGEEGHAHGGRGGEQVHVDPAQTLAGEPLRVDESKHFAVLDEWRGWKRGERTEDLASPRQVPAREFPDDEDVRPHLPGLEQVLQRRIGPAEVVHPDGRIDEHWLTSDPRTASPNRAQRPLATAQRREAPRALARDEGAEALVNHGRLLAQSGQLARPIDQGIIEKERRPHMHHHGI